MSKTVSVGGVPLDDYEGVNMSEETIKVSVEGLQHAGAFNLSFTTPRGRTVFTTSQKYADELSKPEFNYCLGMLVNATEEFNKRNNEKHVDIEDINQTVLRCSIIKDKPFNSLSASDIQYLCDSVKTLGSMAERKWSVE